MVSLLSQYVIFNRFLRIKSIFFSFIFLIQRKMADYDTYTILFFQSALRDLTFKALSSMKTIKLKENHLNPNALCAICLELFNRKQVCFKCCTLQFTLMRTRLSIFKSISFFTPGKDALCLQL